MNIIDYSLILKIDSKNSDLIIQLFVLKFLWIEMQSTNKIFNKIFGIKRKQKYEIFRKNRKKHSFYQI